MPNHHAHWHKFYQHRNVNMFYGPSRIVWFAFGSVATWAWIRHHERNPQGTFQGTWCHPRVDYRRVREEPFDGDHGYGERRQTPNMSREWQRPVPMSQGTGTSTATGVAGPQMQQSPVDPDFERVRQMGRNAEETVSLLLGLLHSFSCNIR